MGNSYDPGTAAISGGSLAQSFLARLLAGLGALERSVVIASEAIERARRAGHLASLANALVGSCTQAWLVRDAALLRSRARALAEQAATQGFPHWAARARGYEGWVAVEEGRVAEGTRLIAGSLASLREAGKSLHVPHGIAMLSDARLLAGDADAALDHIEEALRVTARTGEAWFNAELHRRLGCIQRCLGDAVPRRG